MMTASIKQKGPASAPTLPSHGSSNPQKDQNMDTNSTAAACQATVPYPGHEPVDEMDEAIARLRTIRLALLADSQQIADFSTTDAEMMVGEVLEQLDPIRAFLGENMPVGNSMSFLECRREWFARKGGVE